MGHDYTKMLAIAKRLASLPKAKRDILSQRLADEGIDIWQLPIVPECSEGSEQKNIEYEHLIPLTRDSLGSDIDENNKYFNQVSFAPQSFSQQRLWFIDQLDPGTPIYNLFFGLRFRGRLDRECLQAAMNGILFRHEILRTNVIDSEGVGYQRINPYAPMAIDTVELDLKNINNESEIERQLKILAEQEVGKGFDLSSDLLFRFLLVKIDDEHQVGFFIIHHIVFDAWSTLNLLREFSQLYQFYLEAGVGDDSETKTLPLSRLPIQYKDFARWQRRWAESSGYRQQVEYWQQQLGELPPALMLSIQKSAKPSELPSHAENNVSKQNGEELGFTLPVTLSQDLYQLAQQQGATLYMVMLAVFNILLRHYSTTQDICIGTSIANRPRLETEPLLGLFVNTLVMRNQVDDTLSFADFLQNVKKTATEACGHQDLPFDHLLEVLNIERTDAHSSLFQVLFVMNNATVGAANDTQLVLPGITISGYENPVKTARFDLTLRVSELEHDAGKQGRLIRFDIEYDTALFNSDSINNMLQHYQCLLKQVCDKADEPIQHLSLLDQQTATKKLQLSAGEWQDYNAVDCIHQLFEKSAKEHSEEPALICDSDTLNYRQLNESANQLAHYLRAEGVTRETRVALFMERSTSLIVGLLAILKAGGVYVPLDTQWPRQRIQALLDDSHITIVLSETIWQEQLDSLLNKQPDRKIVYVDKKQSQQSLWVECSKSNPEKTTSANDAAYIIYTSGSTGKPKGVVIEHGQLVNYSFGVMSRLFPQPSSLAHSFASVSTVAADLGNTAIYGALCFGGCLHLLSSRRSFDPDAVAEYMDQHQVEVLKIVPSHLSGLLATGNPQGLLPKKILLLGGEACSSELVQTARQLSPRLRIINHYGPTETTVGTLTYEIPQNCKPSDIIPIGRPLPNTQVYVLDANANVCPEGVAGELFIGGKGVAREYQQQPELTDQSFINRQLHIDMPVQRLYRTGDRARYLRSGDIEFLGRIDEQVKLRGYRIELGDIRTCLRDQVGVNDAVVMIEEADTNKQLVAYVVMSTVADNNTPEANSVTADNLRVALAEYLPEYMVPQQFVIIEALPLTDNGKLDRAALHELKTDSCNDKSRTHAPRDELESQLVTIWSEVLGRENVSIHDNFFALGGDSILSLQVIAKAKKAGIVITPKQLFDEKNIANLTRVAKTVYSDVEKTLLSIWNDVLKRNDIDRHANFFSLGGDSILSLQVVAQARKAGLKLTPKQMFDYQTVAKLAALVQVINQPGQQKDINISGNVPLTPIQQWFFATGHPHEHHWNQSIVFSVKQKLDLSALKKAIATVVKHHDQLRSEFKCIDGQWQQNITVWSEHALTDYFHQVAWLTKNNLDENAEIDHELLNRTFLAEANAWQRSLQLDAKKSNDNGQIAQLFKVICFAGNDRVADRLLIIAHHLLIDGVSWRILLEDLQSLYYHYHNGGVALSSTELLGEKLPLEVLPEKTLSFQEWAKAHEAIAQETDSDWFQDAKTYWAEMHALTKQRDVLLQPNEHDGTLNKTYEYKLQFEQKTTEALLKQAPQAYTTRINDLLLTALYLAFSKQQKQSAKPRSLYVELEGHGRETIHRDFDISRTIGWFTSRFPVLLDGPVEYNWENYGDETLGFLIKSVKEQLRKVPQQGMTYGVLRYLSNSFNELSAMDGPAISFNYLGQIDSQTQPLFMPLDDMPAMTERHPDSRLNHCLDINASVVDGILHVHWRVADNIFPHLDIKRLVDDYHNVLVNIITHCSNNKHRAFTPSDFALADITQTQLDNIVDHVGYEAIEDIYPLSPVQQGMLFHSLYTGQVKPSKAKSNDDMEESVIVSGGAYFNQMLFDLHGLLHVDHLRAAWQFVIDRHSILRSGFFSAQLSQPLQLVYRNKKISIDTHDWRSLSGKKCDQLRENFIVQDKQEGFNLNTAPLMRVTLWQLDDKHWQILWSRHHLLLDGWSSARFMQEVMVAYYAYLQKQNPAAQIIFQQRPTPYKDYITWLYERSYGQSQTKIKCEIGSKIEQAEYFWRDYLSNFSQPTPVPGRDRSLVDNSAIEQPSDIDLQHHDWNCHVSTELCQQLKIMAQQYQITLNSLMQGAWALLLARYFGDDIVFGVTSAGRSAPLSSIETMLGVFISTLPVRVQVDESVGLREFLQKVQSNHASVREFEHTSLTEVQAWSDIESGLSLFESLLVFENYFVGTDSQINNQINNDASQTLDLRVKKSYEPTNYPLTLTIAPVGFDSGFDTTAEINRSTSKGASPSIELQFAFSQMDEVAVQRLAKYYQNILASMVAAMGDTPLSAIDILDKQQLHQQIYQWNDTATDYPRNACWQDLFTQQVAKTPNAIAASCQGQQISYQQLDQRSNRLARAICKQLLDKSSQIVALLDYRGLDLLTMMIAVFKAGAAYLPLDPEYPPSRLTKILFQAKIELVLIGDGLSEIADGLSGKNDDTAATTYVKSIHDLLTTEDDESCLPSMAQPNDLAYVIFTSGSTGEPKGVMVEHLGMLNNIYSKLPSLGLTDGDVIAQTASQCFDISVWQFLTALIVGARVEIYPDNISHDPQALFSAVEKDRITILESVPSFIFALLESTKKGTANKIALRWLLPTGEALTPQLAREWLTVYPHIPLMNAYGPAECSDDVAFWPIDMPPAASCVHMPIGRPTDNNQLFILDKNLRPLPVGAEGELYIAGTGVGRGYLHDTTRTAGAFIENPFASLTPVIPGTDLNRLYRTGDLACYREDGALVYRGRVDYQVKIRGLRIELGEIEALINNHDNVEQCVVIDNTDDQNVQRLVAYVTSRLIKDDTNEALSEQLAEQLRILLQSQLPRYMVPAAFVVLEKLPLSHNGKVDRKALPVPDWTLNHSSYMAPRNEIEQQLCQIWQEVLRTDSIGVEDNFFDLGGHSLLAARLKNDIENQFEVDITLVDLFSNPTIAQLSAIIASVEQNFTDDDLDWMDDLMSSMEEPTIENSELE